MEFNNGVAVVRRKAVFLEKNGLAVVWDAIIPCDKGNHFAPLWPLTISFMGKQFKFVRDAHEPQKRPIYEEMDESEEAIQEPQPTIEEFKQHVAYYKNLLSIQEDFSSHLVSKIKELSGSNLDISEIAQREIKLFYEQKNQTPTPETET